MSINWGATGQGIVWERAGRPFSREFKVNKDGSVYWRGNYKVTADLKKK